MWIRALVSAGGRVFEWGVPRVWLKDMDMPVCRARGMQGVGARLMCARRGSQCPGHSAILRRRALVFTLVSTGRVAWPPLADECAIEPELAKLDLSSADKCIVWATDGAIALEHHHFSERSSCAGVWEFISSQKAVDIIAPFLATRDPQGVCSCACAALFVRSCVGIGLRGACEVFRGEVECRGGGRGRYHLCRSVLVSDGWCVSE